jgi:hypothetical protein
MLLFMLQGVSLLWLDERRAVGSADRGRGSPLPSYPGGCSGTTCDGFGTLGSDMVAGARGVREKGREKKGKGN